MLLSTQSSPHAQLTSLIKALLIMPCLSNHWDLLSPHWPEVQAWLLSTLHLINSLKKKKSCKLLLLLLKTTKVGRSMGLQKKSSSEAQQEHFCFLNPPCNAHCVNEGTPTLTQGCLTHQPQQQSLFFTTTHFYSRDISVKSNHPAGKVCTQRNSVILKQVPYTCHRINFYKCKNDCGPRWA